MKKLLPILAAAGSAALFSSCAVTGDPTQGGIFWSESMAQDRIAQRQAALESIESDTARIQRQNRQMERQLDR